MRGGWETSVITNKRNKVEWEVVGSWPPLGIQHGSQLGESKGISVCLFGVTGKSNVGIYESVSHCIPIQPTAKTFLAPEA